MKALMIDIETLSLSPTAAVTQIGFCAANVRTGEYLVQPTNLFLEATPHTNVDAETIYWWMRQSDAARAAVYPENVERISAALAFYRLECAYKDLGGKEAGVTVWGSPAMFDLPILTHTFKLVRPDLRESKPWPYHMERDLMTLYKMLDPEKKLKPTNPVEHDAASDAKAQMDHLIAIFQANPQILEGAK